MLDKNELPLNPLGKLVVYGELKQILRTKLAYDKLLKESTNNHLMKTVQEYGRKYGLE